ncbi:hypothetical protein NDU88_003606 [Pleurodeles waltl]|uniref:Uncharacterized protein n=1 Tax=Pleurodeles waltl TaxID=8319 RepID=A0AAV7KYY4_PLEWA|nr:hypothetical protein NDU88_003606 [Pleurodeles waltl]
MPLLIFMWTADLRCPSALVPAPHKLKIEGGVGERPHRLGSLLLTTWDQPDLQLWVLQGYPHCRSPDPKVRISAAPRRRGAPPPSKLPRRGSLQARAGHATSAAARKHPSHSTAFLFVGDSSKG